MTENIDWSEVLTGEMLFVGLLGKLWYQYPDRAWYQALLAEDVFTEAPFGNDQPEIAAGLAQLQTWQRGLGADGLAGAFGDLASDYTRLFIGPGKVLAMPWESAHFNDERLLFQEQSTQVRAWYRRFGLETANDGREPEDHIGLELVFIAHLASQGLAALEAGNARGFAETLDAQRTFAETHLLKWAPAWCHEVETKARTDFFRAAAKLTRGVLSALTTRLALPAEVAAA
jgi:TorA maturation chaperone TorD